MQIANIIMSAVSSFVILAGSFTHTYNDKDISSPLMLINKDSMITESYVPNTDKARIAGNEKLLRKDAIENAELMFAIAKDEKIYLHSFSTYRSYGTQKLIFNRKLNLNDGNIDAVTDYVALPGASEHQLGLAIDIVGSRPRLNDRFADSPEGKWIAENSYKFGFIVRYPKEYEDITGIKYEPWHIRYVGKNAAKVIYEKNIPMEKYVSLLRLEKYKELLTIK